MTTTFTPGDAVGICGPTAHLIAGIRLDDPRLPRLWEVLSRGSADAVNGVLEVFLEDGFGSMPAFAVAATDGTSTRVVVRHPAVVEATVDGTPVVSSSTPGGTWSDVTVEGASTVELRAGADAATNVRLPFHAGMTPASTVRVVLDDAAGAVAPTAPVAAAAPVVPVADEPAAPEVSPEVAPEPEATPLTAIWKGHEAAAEEPVPEAPAAEATADEPVGEPAEEPVEEPEEEPVEEPAPSDEPDGSTVLRPVLPKAVPPPPAPPTPPAPPAPPAATPAPASAPASGGLIDGVPWLTADWSATSATPAPPKPAYETPSRPAPPAPPAPAAPAPATPPAPAPGSDDEDGDDAPTVLRAELVKELGSAGIVGPSVLAVDCPNGHQTSAHEPTCRLCGEPVGDSQEPRQIPRPPLGALVLASGDRLVLDKDAVLGRAPHEPEGATERPHLLRVGDNGDISRQHARIMLDGWHVIVRDLGTANGTTLTLPGGSPQQLRANEDYQLEDGAEIGIADVVTLRYEVKP